VAAPALRVGVQHVTDLAQGCPELRSSATLPKAILGVQNLEVVQATLLKGSTEDGDRPYEVKQGLYRRDRPMHRSHPVLRAKD